ncbi:MAG: nitrous oxide reductase accessory protein NosL [Candidatus Thiodiazotropha sp.]
MRSGYTLAPALLLVLSLLTGCLGESDSGPLSSQWEKDNCERCNMALSDRYHAAQVRYFPPQTKQSAVAWFDDIGCAVLWLADKPWAKDPQTRIWVTDRDNGVWIDATKAIYVKGDHTPMGYGLGAQEESHPDGLDFAQAKRYIQAAELRYRRHAAHLLQRLEEQQALREAKKERASGHNLRHR